MTKTPILAGLGIAATAGGGVGAAALSGAFGAGSSNISPSHSAQHITKKYQPRITSSKDVTKKHKELPCSKKLFEKVDWKEGSSDDQLTSLSQNEHVQMTYDATGCLSVWWDKEKHGENWKGRWNVLWGMKENNYGTVFISTVNAENGKIQVEGSFYVLQSQTEGWTVVGKKTVSPQDVTSSNKDNLIVDGEKVLQKREEAWAFDFVSENVCSENKKCESNNPEISTFEVTWDYSLNKPTPESSTTKVKSYRWSKIIDKWIYKGLFGSNIDISSIYSNTEGYYKLATP